jgi:hypothetical protein
MFEMKEQLHHSINNSFILKSNKQNIIYVQIKRSFCSNKYNSYECLAPFIAKHISLIIKTYILFRN